MDAAFGRGERVFANSRLLASAVMHGEEARNKTNVVKE